jgi:hypothetical protein
MQTKHLDAPVIAQSDLPDEVLKAGEGVDIDMWVYASVETADREGDIVRVKGIDTTSFAQGGGALKFLVAHQRGPMADGSLPVLGKAVKWVATKHKTTGLPAMATAIKFAPTELAQDTKKLYDGGFLTDVSIGFQPKKSTPIQGGGFDYEECAVAELSACITGMNPLASIVRAIEDQQPMPSVHASLEEQKAFFAPAVEKLDALIATATELKAELAATAKQLKVIDDRIDNLEDSVSSMPKGADPQDDRTDRQTPRTIDRDRLNAFLNATL